MVIAGGTGSRFWPWSRRDCPKQFLALTGERTMLEDTVARIRGLVPPDNILVATGEKYRHAVKRALPWIRPEAMLCEPEGRNTAPCIGWAALEIRRRQAAAVMAVFPADHVVAPHADFRSQLRIAMSIADSTRRLLTFGIRPTCPATGYGYIKAGRALNGAGGAKRVLGFYEKPSLRRAAAFFRSRAFFWNSGMFVWRADSLLKEIEAHLPRLAAGLAVMDKGRRRGRIPRTLLERTFPRLPKISVDHGVMEATDKAIMLPASFSWNDVGSWDALGDLLPADGAGNTSRDPLVAINAHGNVVASHGKPVALIGVDDLAVVDSKDALLVCRRELSQEVRSLNKKLEKKGLGKIL